MEWSFKDFDGISGRPLSTNLPPELLPPLVIILTPVSLWGDNVVMSVGEVGLLLDGNVVLDGGLILSSVVPIIRRVGFDVS